MKKIILILLLFVAGDTFAQTYSRPQPALFGLAYLRVKSDSFQHIPRLSSLVIDRDTTPYVIVFQDSTWFRINGVWTNLMRGASRSDYDTAYARRVLSFAFNTSNGTLTAILGSGQRLDIGLDGRYNKIGDTSSMLSGYARSGNVVPNTRTLTINGTSYDLSADRSWTVAAGVTSVFGRTGAVTALIGDYSSFYLPIASPAFTGTLTGPTVTTTGIITSGLIRLDPGGDLEWNNGTTWQNVITFSGTNTAVFPSSPYITNASQSLLMLNYTGTGAWNASISAYNNTFLIYDETSSRTIMNYLRNITTVSFGANSVTASSFSGAGSGITGVVHTTGNESIYGLKAFMSGEIDLVAANTNYFYINRLNSSGNEAAFVYQTNTTNKWVTGMRGVSNDDYLFYSFTTGTNILSLSQATGEVTFTNSIQINSGNQFKLYRPDNAWWWTQYMDAGNTLNYAVNGGAPLISYTSSGGATFSNTVNINGGADRYLNITSASGSYAYLQLTAGTNTGYIIQNLNGSAANGVTALGAMYAFMSNSQNFEFIWSAASKIQFTSAGAGTFAGSLATGAGGSPGISLSGSGTPTIATFGTNNLVISTGLNMYIRTPTGSVNMDQGPLNVSGTVTANGGIISTGTVSGNFTNTSFLDWYGVTARLIVFGDNVTNGAFTIISKKNDGSNALTEMTSNAYGNVTFAYPLGLGAGYTVAGLPAAGVQQGQISYVTDALTPSFGVVVVGGGSTKIPVFYNGTNWVAF